VVPVLAIVTFPAQRLDPEALRRLLDETGPRYLAIPGLRRKYFLQAEGLGGGAYEWESREHADRFHDGAWRARMTAQAGAEPHVAYFTIAAIADAERGRVDHYT
jgi:hypothetical protein